MEDDFNFEAFSVNVDSDCITNDFDDYDIFGEITENDNFDNFGDNIEFE